MHPKTLDTAITGEYLNTVVVVSGDGSASASRAQVALTRPANVVAYPVNGVISGPITFPTMGALGGSIMLTSCDLRIDIPTIATGMTSFRLHIYTSTPPSAFANAAVWTLTVADRASYVGYIDVAAPLDFGPTLFSQSDNTLNKQVKLDATETALYGYLVSSTAYTPASVSEVYSPTLRAVAV